VDRVIGFYKVFVFVAFILVLPVWSISMAAPSSILNLMLPDVTFTIQNLNYFRAIIAIVPLLCIVLTAMTFYPAIKKPKPAMLFGIGRQLFLYIPLMIILPKIFGVASIYYGSLAIDLGLALVIVVLLKKEFRILRRGYK